MWCQRWLKYRDILLPRIRALEIKRYARSAVAKAARKIRVLHVKHELFLETERYCGMLLLRTRPKYRCFHNFIGIMPFSTLLRAAHRRCYPVHKATAPSLKSSHNSWYTLQHRESFRIQACASFTSSPSPVPAMASGVSPEIIGAALAVGAGAARFAAAALSR